jgi:anti-sigma-K factor RskA
VNIARISPALTGLRDKTAFWRAATEVLATTALALLVAALVAREPADFSNRPVVAVVRDSAQHPAWAIRLARAAHQIAADSLAPEPVAPGHVYQLWLKMPGAAPLRPLGLLPRSGRKAIPVTPADTRLLAGAGELIVTVEPTGGSPNQGPSGPALLHGPLGRPG